jgi:hypothetical protein
MSTLHNKTARALRIALLTLLPAGLAAGQTTTTTTKKTTTTTAPAPAPAPRPAPAAAPAPRPAAAPRPASTPVPSSAGSSSTPRTGSYEPSRPSTTATPSTLSRPASTSTTSHTGYTSGAAKPAYTPLEPAPHVAAPAAHVGVEQHTPLPEHAPGRGEPAPGRNLPLGGPEHNGLPVRSINEGRGPDREIPGRAGPGRNVLVHGEPFRGLAPRSPGDYRIPERRGPIARPVAFGVHDFAVRDGAIRRRPDGRFSDFHDTRHNLDIHHNLVGGRRIEIERRDHAHLIVDHGRRGYLERPYAFQGHDLVRRTYVYQGHVYDRFYHPYEFHGVHLAVYAPARFYPAGFYGYAYHPFPAPVHYAWAYVPPPPPPGGVAYFAPAPVEPTPSAWLADFALVQTIGAGVQAQLAGAPRGGAAGSGDAGSGDRGSGDADAGDAPQPMSDDVRDQLADEIQGQVSLENSEAYQNSQGQPTDPGSSSIARSLADGQTHVFLAGEEADVIGLNGQECALTEGDVIATNEAPAADSDQARAVVVASKDSHDCKLGTTVYVAVATLQEMQNHLRELVDQGLGQLQTAQASGALPPAPAAANAAQPPSVAMFALIAPPPDPSIAGELDKQEAEADKSEKELLKTLPKDTDKSQLELPRKTGASQTGASQTVASQAVASQAGGGGI